MLTESKLEDARRFAGLGFSVIPLKHGEKTPAIASWTKYQTEKATDDDLVRWFGNEEKEGAKNIGIVTGRVSGVVVVDTDCPAAEQWAEAHFAGNGDEDQDREGRLSSVLSSR
jgi:hypothetical protein